MIKVVEMAAVRHLELKSHKRLKKKELKMNPSELVLVTGGQNGPNMQPTSIVEFCRLSQCNIYNNNNIENNSKHHIKHSRISA